MVVNYFGCVIKVCILDVVWEGVGEQVVELIVYLKKGEMVIEVEWLLVGSGWLLEFLWIDDQDVIVDVVDVGSVEVEILFDFFMGDGEDDEFLEDEEQVLM